MRRGWTAQKTAGRCLKNPRPCCSSPCPFRPSPISDFPFLPALHAMRHGHVSLQSVMLDLWEKGLHHGAITVPWAVGWVSSSFSVPGKPNTSLQQLAEQGGDSDRGGLLGTQTIRRVVSARKSVHPICMQSSSAGSNPARGVRSQTRQAGGEGRQDSGPGLFGPARGRVVIRLGVCGARYQVETLAPTSVRATPEPRLGSTAAEDRQQVQLA